MNDKIVIVYLAHPFTGNPKENIQRVTQIAERIVESSKNRLFPCFYAPLVPHLVLSPYNEANMRDVRTVTEAVSSALVRACDELWVVSPILSAGMKMEIKVAETAGIPILEWVEVIRVIPEIANSI